MALLTGLIIFEGIYFIYSMKTNQELQRKKSHHKGETSPRRSIYSICVFSVVFFEQQEQPYAAIYFRHIHSNAHLMATSMLSNYGSSVYHRTGKIHGARSIQTDRQNNILWTFFLINTFFKKKKHKRTAAMISLIFCHYSCPAEHFSSW